MSVVCVCVCVCVCVLAGGWEGRLCVYECVMYVYVYGVCVCWLAGGRERNVCMSV